MKAYPNVLATKNREIHFTKISQVLSAGVSLSVHSVRHKEVLTVTEIKHPPAAQLSSTGTWSKWPLNSISVSTPDNAEPLPANHWACYAANCSFRVLDHRWRIHSRLCLSSALPDPSRLCFLRMIYERKTESLMTYHVIMCIYITKDSLDVFLTTVKH